MSDCKCLILIPAHNEQDNIQCVIREIRATGVMYDLLVIDDGSTDDTADMARATGETVLSLPFNLGYASAMQTGFKLATTLGFDYVVQFDGDGQHDPRDIAQIVEALKVGNDVVIGSRALGMGSDDLGKAKKLVIGILCRIIKATTGKSITDPTSGLRGLSRRAFSNYARMGKYPEDYPDADTLMRMIRSGLKVTEVPANIRRRLTGSSHQFAGLKCFYYVVKMLVSVLVVLLSSDRLEVSL